MAGTMRPPIVDTITKMRVILTGIVQRCEPPYVAYFEANRELPWQFLKMFAVIDLDDVAKDMIRPPGLRSQRHGRKGKRFIDEIPGLPDPSEKIGKRLHAQELVDILPAGIGRTGLFVISDLVDNLEFTPVLVDMVTDIGFDPIMGMVAADPNACPFFGRFLGQTFGAVTGGAGPPWKAFGYQVFRYAHIVHSNSGFSYTIPDGRYVNTFAARIRGLYGSTDVQLRMLDAEGGLHVIAESYVGHVTPDDTVTLMVTETTDGPAQIRWEVRTETSFVTVEWANFSALNVII